MLTLIRYELLKTFRKLRTYIGFGLILVLVPIAYWGMSLGGDDMVRDMTRGLQKDFLFVGSLFNGWFVANLMMNTLFVHIPFLIVLVAGDILAGEATGGTLRILLTRPPGRTRLFVVKTASTVIYTLSLVFFLGGFSIVLGLLLFGSGDLLWFSQEGIAIYPAAGVVWRFILAYVLAAWAMCSVAALALLFSSFVENAIGPIVGSMAVVILFLILGNLPFEFFEGLRPYLFTTYMDVWERAFGDPIEWDVIARKTAMLGIFFALFTGAAWAIFRRKDVLS
ncbi:MAG: ABC transporter permease [Ignavibacteriae bacterium]|nr:ABC transporter permease [Ignavibacteriota bacterium]